MSVVIDGLINRNADVVSGSYDLESLYCFHNFPVFMGCTDQPPSTDLFADMHWHISRSSGMIQLNPCLPLNVVYKEEHGSGTTGKAWGEHHSAFADFIFKDSVENVLEIGGLHGHLFHKVRERGFKTPWTIIEPNPHIENPMDAKIIRGFFDSNFKSDETYDCIVFSHVLEHIYDVNEFLENISKFLDNGTIIFSVPNMNVMLERCYTNCINFEHTIFLGECHIEYLLAKNNFRIIDKQYHKDDHSIFYRAEKEEYVSKPFLGSFTCDHYKELFNKYIEWHITDVEKINNLIEGKKNVYLFGAHIFSQYLLAFGLDPINIVCILDNDKNKQGKRLYGTNLGVHSPKLLESIKKPIVILRAGVYNDEIKKDILENINSEAVFV